MRRPPARRRPHRARGAPPRPRRRARPRRSTPASDDHAYAPRDAGRGRDGHEARREARGRIPEGEPDVAVVEHPQQLELQGREGRESAAQPGAEERPPVARGRQALLQAGGEVAEQRGAGDVHGEGHPRPAAGVRRERLRESRARQGAEAAAGEDGRQLAAVDGCGHGAGLSRQERSGPSRYRSKALIAVMTLPRPKPWFLLLLAGLLLGVHAVKDVLGADAGAFGTVVSAWFEPVAFLACGLAVLWRARDTERRAPWLLVGAGLCLYASGNVFYNLAYSKCPAFPSPADGLWLSLYPLSFAGLALLVHGRFRNLSAGVWLDGVIGGGVVAAIVAAAVFNSVFDVTVAGGAASIARLAYPVGDLVMVGVVIAVWSVTGRRLSPLWAALGLGFGLLAVGDSAYVVQAAHGTWAPGNGLDYPYALGTMLIAAAAWLPAPAGRTRENERTGVRLPVACGLAALTLTSVAVLVGLNPLATVLSLITMLAVVMRLASTLARVNRQSRELAALAAADPLTGLPNHRTVHEQLSREL